VKAWIHQQLEARGETDQHFTPPSNVRKFEPVEPLADEDGWK
jgi:gluconate kinase